MNWVKRAVGVAGIGGRRLANQIAVRKQEKEVDRCTCNSLGRESQQVDEKRVSKGKKKKEIRCLDSPSNVK